MKMSHNKILGFDAYNLNFAVLMILTAVEIIAVALTFSMKGVVSMDFVVFVLISVGVIKLLGIAGIFMHLWGEEDSKIMTMTALFPAFFIIVMILFIGITHPGATDTLPSWCRPGFYYGS
jgi:heme/copper-type cytochrome/quinol oxidase subunit 4